MKAYKRLTILFLTCIFLFGSLGVSARAKTVSLVTHIATVNTGSLRLRSGPSTGYKTIASAPLGDYVLITGKAGDWYRVIYNLQSGYMHGDYLKSYAAKNVELGYGTVTGNQVNVRSGPATSYQTITKANTGDLAYVIGINRQWYKVIYSEVVGYIRSDYLDITQIPYENAASPHKPLFFVNGKSTGVTPSAAALKSSTATNQRNQIVSEAKRYLGVPYLWGGNTPNGFDCSGFVQYVLKQCGIAVPRTTELQVSVGSHVSKSKLLPGDLVFLQNTYRSGVSHVGVYIGNNKMIHASSSKGVIISDLSTSYYTEHFHSGRQIVH